jgi:IS30 family transposase
MVMDQTKLQSILEALPPKTMRSKLEPLRQLILELRERDRSYREIARVLAEHCQVQVSPSTIHDFVMVRTRQEPLKSAVVAGKKEPSGYTPNIMDSDPQKQIESRRSEASQRLTALKQRKISEPVLKPAFIYREDEPLKLIVRSEQTNRS